MSRSVKDIQDEIKNIEGLSMGLVAAGFGKELAASLRDDEAILNAVLGQMDANLGLIAVTAQRIFWVTKGIFRGKVIQEWSRPETRVLWEPDGMAKTLIIVAEDDRTEFTVSDVEQGRSVAATAATGVAADRKYLTEHKPEEDRLRKLTNGWTTPHLVRTYESNEQGSSHFRTESEILDAHGYEPSGQSEEGGHVHAGRILLTGGLSIFAGKRGIRSEGKITMTYRLLRDAAAPAESATASVPTQSAADEIRKFAELRDAGVISDEEFEAKKAQLLGL